jgi:hypothetical protein
MIYLGRSDQQFTRHAADARTGGSVVRRLDDQQIFGMLACNTVGSHTRRASANYGNINFSNLHLKPLSKPQKIGCLVVAPRFSYTRFKLGLKFSSV